MTMDNATSIMGAIGVIDRSGLTTRDVRILHSIAVHPGQCGSDIVTRLKLHSRSSVQSNLPKLIKHGLIIDEREREGQAIPSQYYVTEEGKAFLRKVLGQ